MAADDAIFAWLKDSVTLVLYRGKIAIHASLTGLGLNCSWPASEDTALETVPGDALMLSFEGNRWLLLGAAAQAIDRYDNAEPDTSFTATCCIGKHPSLWNTSTTTVGS